MKINNNNNIMKEYLKIKNIILKKKFCDNLKMN